MDKIIILFYMLIPKSHGVMFNLAHNKRVYTSSFQDPYLGIYAVDGDVDENNYALADSYDAAAWFVVDLGRPYLIEYILMHNRQWCRGCGNHMNKFTVGVLNDFDSNIKIDWTKQYTILGICDRHVNNGEVVRLDNIQKLKYYRYVIIHKDRNNYYLSTRELEIHGNYINYIGCFEDLQDNDVIGTKMNLVGCINKCEKSYHLYAGLKNGEVCFCGNATYQARPLVECNIACDNGVDYCGGKALISVYSVYPQKRGEIGGKYQGCYFDKPDSRDFTLISHGFTIMTIDTCQRFCLEKHYLYFGLQNGTICSCSNTFSLHGISPSSDCVTPCSGNKMQICGGTNRNSVYSINKVEECLNFSKVSYNCKGGVGLDMHGNCKNNQCEDGWAGDSCSMRDCSKYNGDCGIHKCKKVPVFLALVSECVCEEGFSKPAWWEPCNGDLLNC